MSERATGGEHRVEDETGAPVEVRRDLDDVFVRGEGRFVTGDTDEGNLSIGQQLERGVEQADPGSQHGHEQRWVGEPPRRCRSERGLHRDLGGGVVPARFVDEHGAQFLEGGAEQLPG